MPCGGWLADRWTSARLLRIAAPLCAMSLAGPALASSIWTLAGTVIVLGLLMGILNASLNVHAVQVERRLGKPIISTLHGMWTLGAVAGGGLTSAGLRTSGDVRVLSVCGALVLAVSFLVTGRLLTVDGQRSAPVKGSSIAVPAVPNMGLLIALGVLGTGAFLTEGTAMDWAGIHASRVLGAPPGTAALAYTVVLGVAAGSARSLSTITAISYAGTLAGPPLIGYVAAATSLPTALFIPASLALTITTVGPLVLRRITSQSERAAQPVAANL